MEESPLITHARHELQRAGMFDADADYGGALASAVMELVTVLASQGHSGMSHAVTMAVFNEVANYKPLTPLTSDPDEWNDVSAISGYPFWQSRRDSSAFSHDGGQTWYLLGDSPSAPPVEGQA